ncbi:MAG TPA: hypothetical protein PKJ68_00360 [Candidatus Woesebacteria bacterium]|nr:hypothetical protein [Candidatus Woesebacteria bacterium]
MEDGIRNRERGSFFQSPPGRNDGFQHDIQFERTGRRTRVTPLTDKHTHRVLTAIVKTVWGSERGHQRGSQLQVDTVIETALLDVNRSDFPVGAVSQRLGVLRNFPRCLSITDDPKGDVVAQGVPLESNAECGLCRLRRTGAKGGCTIEGTPYRHSK